MKFSPTQPPLQDPKEVKALLSKTPYKVRDFVEGE